MFLLRVATIALLPAIVTAIVAYVRWHSVTRPWTLVIINALVLYAAAFYFFGGAVLNIGTSGQPSADPTPITSSWWFRPAVLWLVVATAALTTSGWALRK